MGAPQDTEVIAWLRAQGVDPDAVVPESMQGARIAGTNRCVLLFVVCTARGTYCAQRLEVDIPPWARRAGQIEPPVDRTPTEVMADHLDAWLHREPGSPE